MRCYVCSWSATLCQDFNCYNNPDVCTNNNFSPTIVRSVECPSGCESFVVTGESTPQMTSFAAAATQRMRADTRVLADPNGLVQQWRRNCDSSGETYGQWRDPYQKCSTQYQLGLRITRCTCNDHLCNSSPSHGTGGTLLLISVIAFAVTAALAAMTSCG